MDQDLTDRFQSAIKDAKTQKQSLSFVGGGSKAFYSGLDLKSCFDVSAHTGVINYDPTELILTVRSGTRLTDINSLLAENNQILGFDPPLFNDRSTIGGVVASGLSGPARMFRGSVKDYVLGVKLINGLGDVGRYGGEVMKNVAGYDVSRLMVGSMGKLGLITEVSLKLLPRPASEVTRVFEVNALKAIGLMGKWMNESLPLSGLSFYEGKLYVRLAGLTSAVKSAEIHLGGENLVEEEKFWAGLKDQSLPFFRTEKNIWRISVLPNTPPIGLSGPWFYEWGGAKRWLITDETDSEIAAAVEGVEGHATRFRSKQNLKTRFPKTPEPLVALRQRIKTAFDPFHVFN